MSAEFGPLVIPWDSGIASDLSDAAAVWVAQNTTPDADWAEVARFPQQTDTGLISVGELLARSYAAGIRDSGMHLDAQARLRGV